uniref:Chromosome 20 open reading frame 96 n=1 Tax=Catagonus wagneri TaxID=51154 RepID=A0A8C3WGY6_9CETA
TEVLSRPHSFQTRPRWDLLRSRPVPDSGVQATPTLWMTSQPRNPPELRRGKLDSGKTHTKIRLLRTMLRHRRVSHQELCNHEDFLTKLNRELIKAIQDTEESWALKVRAMLQQQDVFMTIIDILEYSNKKKLQQMERELQEWEEKEESKMHSLEQQVEQLNAKIEKVHEKVCFVSTYKDHEYPIKSVRAASLVRQLQQTKDSQQDELDDLHEMCRMVLASMSSQIQKKEKNLLRSLVVKIQKAHQEALLQKSWDSQAVLKYMDKIQKFMDQFEEEIPVLRAEMEQLQFQIWEPREVAFADVLLRRSKCSPDTDVILNIPVEEPLPF